MKRLVTDWKGVSAGDLVIYVSHDVGDCPNPHPREDVGGGWVCHRDFALGTILQVEEVVRYDLCHCYGFPGVDYHYCNGCFKPYTPGQDRQELLEEVRKELVDG